ncbi:HAD-IA family hydrolase [Rubellimicrobium aerolatum]|uniref:phosphoglycolate phosphatase n=1 Tax=Rubellimicrobium aerolatum TaxID=490979 RepID=A0ABW0SBF4_9RHOB|nr:HAD-IA family hydrolase [Rubellimicrobium aerolatum]MBP1805575.1 phosphoglycolate phosphatase [Rubellimicrobium aerolatum]
MTQSPRTVIFDLDGTLADTSGDLLAAANACFRDLGLGEILHAGDAGVALRGGRAMLTLGFERAGAGHGTEEVDRQYPRLLTHYEAAICDQTLLYPGAAEAVLALRATGYRTGICTNKPERLARLLLARLDVTDLFDSLIGADTLPVRKPDPRPLAEAVHRAGGHPARACLVGDTDTDHLTARAAGVPSILVTFGPLGEAAAAALGPEVLLHSFADLPDAVDALSL